MQATMSTIANVKTTKSVKATKEVKAPKTPKATKEVKKTENLQSSFERAESLAKKLHSAIVARVNTLRDSNQNIAVEFASISKSFSDSSFVRCIEKTENIFNFALFAKVITKHKTSGSTDNQYMQAKTIVKVITFIRAIANSDMKKLDTYTKNIIFNAMINNGKISAKGAFASLAKVEFDAMTSSDEILTMRSSYSTGTASSQKSSTREAMRVLGCIADGSKGAHDAPLELTPEAQKNIALHFEPIAKKLGIV